MKLRNTISNIAFLLVFAGTASHAQDLHFSQFFNSPLTTNPANTGFLPDADFRLGALYRNQYSSILAAPYKTFSIFVDGQVLRNKLENGWLGLGAYIMNDVAGSGSLRTTQVYGSLAYHQMLGNSSLLTAGFNLGRVSKTVDESKLIFPEQILDGQVLPGHSPILVNNNISYFDMQVGMNYAYFPDENVYINAGYSIHHVNGPSQTFFSNNLDSSRLPMRHIGFVNALLKVNDRLIINPNIYYTNQAKASETVIGMNANINLSEEDGSKQLIAGAYYRLGDAIIPMAGFEINNIRFTFSYDVTTSALKSFNNMQGASEFSVIKKGFYNESNASSRQVMCPKF